MKKSTVFLNWSYTYMKRNSILDLFIKNSRNINENYTLEKISL